MIKSGNKWIRIQEAKNFEIHLCPWKYPANIHNQSSHDGQNWLWGLAAIFHLDDNRYS